MQQDSSFVHVDESLGLTTYNEIEQLWKMKSLCDVNLMVYSEHNSPLLSLPAHRLILSATIPYFKAMFSSNMQEANQSDVTLHHVDPTGLKLIVGYVYTGKLEITEDTAQGILSTASLLGITDIVAVTARFISKHIKHSNCLGVIRFAEMYNLHELLAVANKFLLLNFVKVSREEEYLDLSFDEVASLVSGDSITVDSEQDVYYAVTRWIEVDKEREKFIADLYNHVRFPILEHYFIQNVVLLNSSLANVYEVKVMVQEALDYHENPASVMQFSNPKKAQPRSSVAGIICLAGGSGDSGESLTDVSFFNPHEEQWRSGPKLSKHRTRLALVLFKGELYAIGGADITEPHSSVEKFVPSTNSWVKVASLNVARKSCSAVVTPMGIVVMGGYNGSVYLHSVELYDANVDEWIYQPAMSEARSGLSGVYFEQRIYAIGGLNSKEELRSMERFDLINRKWEKMASMYSPRANAAAAILSKEILVAGGQADKVVINTAEVYNPELNQWEQIVCAMRSPRVGLAMVSIGNLIYVMGGSNGSEYLNTAECYDTSKSEWVEVPGLPTVRFGAAACALSKRDNIAAEEMPSPEN